MFIYQKKKIINNQIEQLLKLGPDKVNNKYSDNTLIQKNLINIKKIVIIIGDYYFIINIFIFKL